MELLRRRAAYHGALGRQLTRVKNRIHAVLARNLVEAPVSDLFSEKGRAFLRRAPLPQDEALQVEMDLHILESLEAVRREAAQHLAGLAHAHPQAQLLMSIPGIDYPTAVGILGAIGEVTRFREPKKLVSYFGLNPIVHQSAQRCYTGRISKQGRCHARWLLVEAAHCAVRPAGPLKAFFLRLKSRKGANVAVVAAARKLTTIIYAAVRHPTCSPAASPTATPPRRPRARSWLGCRWTAACTTTPPACGAKAACPKAPGGRPHYGSGVRARDVRAKQDKARRADAQADYERLIEERTKSPRAPRST